VAPEVRFVTQAADGAYFPSREKVAVPQGIPKGRNEGRGRAQPFVETDAPYHKLSFHRDKAGGLKLVVLNDVGETYTIHRPLQRRSSGTWTGKSWEWLGMAPFNGNQPDAVIQVATCIDSLLPAEQAAELNRIILEDTPRRIAAGGAGTPLAALAKNVSIASICEMKNDGNRQQTIGIWLSRQATPEVLSTARIIDTGYSFGFRMSASTIRQAMDLVWEAQKKELSIAGQTIRLLGRDLEFVDNQPPASDQLKLTVRAEAQMAGLSVGLKATATAAFLIGKKDPLSRSESAGPICGIRAKLEGDQILGKAAEMLLSIAGDLIGFSLSKAQAPVIQELQPICSFADVIPRSELLPRRATSEPLRTLGIDYESVTVNSNGITALAVNPPLPRLRNPQVDWRPQTSTIKLWEFSGGRAASFLLEAVTNEMRAPITSTRWTYQAPNNGNSGVRVYFNDESGNQLSGTTFETPRLAVSLSVPSTVPWNSADLGVLKVVVVDSDGQSATGEKKLQ
jgi:hypothetical protein